MKLTKLTMALIAGLAFTSGSTTLMVRAQEGPLPGEWQPMEPPGNWSSAWHSGFRDGIQAARHDIDAHKQPDPDRHDNFPSSRPASRRAARLSGWLSSRIPHGV